MKKNILITGACGYIGSHFAKLMYESREFNLFAIDNLSTGKRNAISKDIPLLEASLEDVDAVKDFIINNNIKSIFHFAGKIIVPESVANPYKYYSGNTNNTLNLAKIASDCGVEHFVFSSTAAVYGEPDENDVVDENYPKTPISPYGKSKLFAESMIRDICAQSQMRYIILRYFNVAGASEDLSIGQQSPNATHLIKMCCNAALGKSDKMLVYGNDYPTKDGTGVRDFIHVSDLAAAHKSVYEYLLNGGESETFNVGYGEGFSVLDIINAFDRMLNRKIDYEIAPRRAGDAARVVSCNKKILSKTNWRPHFNNIDTIVRHAYLWEKKLSGI